VLRGIELGDFDKIKLITPHPYPTVSQLTSETLAEWMQTTMPLLLVDVRSPEEFAVSHLRGAINLRSVNEIAAAAREREASNVVLYCSVGFRSSRLAQALSGQGVAKVMNLEGSIFQWANEGHPVYQEETQVQKVHPYGKRWAGLLKPGLASEC
jgi:rhodanese-related sulfurtransferase